MKYQLFTYRRGETARTGIVAGDVWLDLEAAAQRAGQPTLTQVSIDDLLQRWDESRAELQTLARQAADERATFAACAVDTVQLQLLAPLTRPGAIYGAGANYRDHVEAMGRAFNMKLVLDPKQEGIAPWHFLKSGTRQPLGSSR